MKKPAWEKEDLAPRSRYARVFSPSNIALSKYWGKRDVALNLPTNGSVSLTLGDYGSFTTVEFDASFSKDRLILNGQEESAAKFLKFKPILDEIRKLAGVAACARIQSMNNFPTAAGLASSASGLSAIALAAAIALELDLTKSKISELARRGSGSACRSVFGGFVEWKKGERADGSDSIAEQLAPSSHWPLDVLIAVASDAQKNHASTGGMEHTRQTSPYFAAWVESAQNDAAKIKAAIKSKDFERLAELAESNCIRMHASAMGARPPVFYWQGITVDVMHRIWALRAKGVSAFFTIDAGPNVVVVCEPQSSHAVASELAKDSRINVLRTRIGEGARALDSVGES